MMNATRSPLIFALCFCTTGGVVTQQSLVAPMRIAEGPPGQVLVSDSNQDLVVAIDDDSLAPVWSFAVQGTPMGVGFSANRVLIGNATSHNVEVYRLKGAPKGPTKQLDFLFNLGHTPRGTPGSIRIPADICVDQAARLAFVLDSGERKIKVFSLDGNPVSTLPAAGTTQPLSPTALAIDPARQEILVSDYGNPNGSFRVAAPAGILIYTYAGEFVRQIHGGAANGVTVPAEALFERPQGLAFDALGRIYMAESARGEIFVFDRASGAVVRKLGSFGSDPGQLSLPLGVLIQQRTGDLLVTNSLLSRIEVFRTTGGLP